MSEKKVAYKLLSIDLDGTLLSPILRRAKTADCIKIQEYMSLGGMPLINTGRAPWAIANAVYRVNKNGGNKIKFCSCLNGAFIHDFVDGKIIEHKIEHEHIKKIYEVVKQHHGAWIWFYRPSGFQEHKVDTYPNLRILNIGYRLSKLRKIKDETDLTSYKLDILSISKKTIESIHNKLIELKLNEVCTISYSSPRLIEVTPLNVTKGDAIEYFAKKYNIQPNEICSLGDTFNDLSAFKKSALKIGINPRNKNFVPHCDAIIDHKSKGVSEAIDKYLIKEENIGN